MHIGYTIAICVFCLPLTGLGLISMFKPAKMAELERITPDGPVGLNAVRGVLGGFFLGSMAMLVAGLVTGETLWFLSVAVLMGLTAIGRAVGFALDGMSKDVLPAFVGEIVMPAVLVAAHMSVA